LSRHRILFVDDDQNLLQGLQRMLHARRKVWDVHFVASGKQALTRLEEEPFDAIVSDMRMPDMDGAELLAAVSKRFPAMLRFILSGYTDEETVMRTVGSAHQFMAKPCPPSMLIDILHRAIELHRLLQSEGLRKLLAGLRTLPTPSATYLAIMECIRNPKASVNAVADLIERDVAMTAELLKLTNSAYFALPSRISTPLQAVRILGFETLRALVFRIGIFRGFEGRGGAGKLIEAINEDSFLVARLARRVAKLDHLDTRVVDEAFCAGMLGSIGTLILIDQLPQAFEKVAAAVQAGEDPLETEAAVFGANHMQLGAYLLGLWGFSKPVVGAVAFSGNPSVFQSDRLDVSGVVHIARVLAGPFPAYAALGEHGEVGRLALDMQYLEGMGRTSSLPGWMMEARAEMGGRF
jgi:HD-like signal output (HDOD) protein/CheY-like chemotaxis protein